MGRECGADGGARGLILACQDQLSDPRHLDAIHQGIVYGDLRRRLGCERLGGEIRKNC